MLTQLAFIGAGNMSEAIARGILRANLFKPTELAASDPFPDRRALFTRELHVRTVESNAEAARDARIVLLAVKPQKMAEAIAELSGSLDPQRSLLVSIAAGVSIDAIHRHLDNARFWRIIRAMPNTPLLVGAGVTALARGRHATDDDFASARRLFEVAGPIIEVSEDKLDAVTAVSGSGPAYFFYLVEQMIHAGIENGLTESEAALLATRTAIGAGRMLESSSDSPAELRRRVTSPGGTTAAAIESMSRDGFERIIRHAIRAATERGRELGKSSG